MQGQYLVIVDEVWALKNRLWQLPLEAKVMQHKTTIELE